LRILTYTSLFPNAEHPLHGIFVYQRVAHLARKPGNEGVVVAPVPYFPKLGLGGDWSVFARVPQEERISDLPVFHPRYPLLPKVSMLFHGWLMYLGCRVLVRQLHAKIPFDVIDAHFIYPDGFAAVLLGRLLKIPVSVSARGTDMNVYPSFPTIRAMLRWTLRHADACIAVSDSLRVRMAEVVSTPQTIQVIPNGVDAARFERMELSEARRTLGLPTEGPFLVSVG
jgi:teichuronic acid biosynthesis glycosyltransferase TuaC